MIIDDGTGSGRSAKVDGRNRLLSRSITESNNQAATDIGNSFNINTGIISLTTNGESSILYVKNNEVVDLHLDALSVGIGTLGGTVTESSVVTLLRNPTGGTVVSDATAADMTQNRNFGSSKALTADVYKGAEGKTLTGGDDIAIFFATGSSRMFASIDMILSPGSSVGVQIDVNDSTGGDVYAAFVCHLNDSEE